MLRSGTRHSILKDDWQREYLENLMHQGFSHHSIAIPGKVGKQLECLERLKISLQSL